MESTVTGCDADVWRRPQCTKTGGTITEWTAKDRAKMSGATRVALAFYNRLLDLLSADVLQRDLTLMRHNVPLVHGQE